MIYQGKEYETEFEFGMAMRNDPDVADWFKVYLIAQADSGWHEEALETIRSISEVHAHNMSYGYDDEETIVPLRPKMVHAQFVGKMYGEESNPNVYHEAWHNPHWPCPDCKKMANLTRWAPSLVAEGHADFYHCKHCGTDFQVAREFDKVEVSRA